MGVGVRTVDVRVRTAGVRVRSMDMRARSMYVSKKRGCESKNRFGMGVRTIVSDYERWVWEELGWPVKDKCRCI